MTDGNPVQLVNRDGKIVGIDPETGETVPIKMGEGLGTEAEPIPNQSHFEGISTESLVNENDEPDFRQNEFDSADFDFSSGGSLDETVSIPSDTLSIVVFRLNVNPNSSGDEVLHLLNSGVDDGEYEQTVETTTGFEELSNRDEWLFYQTGHPTRHIIFGRIFIDHGSDGSRGGVRSVIGSARQGGDTRHLSKGWGTGMGTDITFKTANDAVLHDDSEQFIRVLRQ